MHTNTPALKRALSAILAFDLVLCSAMPASLAYAAEDAATTDEVAQLQEARPLLSYRLNAQQAEDPWLVGDATLVEAALTLQSSEAQKDPVTSLELMLENADGTVQLRTRQEGEAWKDEWSTDHVEGSFEELQIKLTGNVEGTHDVWYRVHTAEHGWLGWAANGASAGSKDLGLAIDDVQVVLLGKEDENPSENNEVDPFLTEENVPTEGEGDGTGEGGEPSDGEGDGTEGEGTENGDGLEGDGTENGDGTEGEGEGTENGDGLEGDDDGTEGENGDGEEGAGDEEGKLPAEGEEALLEGEETLTEEEKAAKAAEDEAAKDAADKEAEEADKDKKDAEKDKKADEAKKDEEKVELQAKNDPAKQEIAVSYSAHVENIGWQKAVSKGAIAGTTGKCYRVEAIKISLPKNTKGGITYAAHVQNIGWQNWVSNGAEAGTHGKGLRVEALKIKLTGDVAKTHNVWYRAHVQNIGWQSWVSNGAEMGTHGKGLRVEAIQIMVLPKGATAPANTGTVADTTGTTQASISYRARMAGVGWLGWMSDGETAGTAGSQLAITSINATLTGLPKSELQYSAHLSNTGWINAVTGGNTAGSSSSRVEAFTMKLTGSAAKKYDVYYHAYVPTFGWLAWAKNGAKAGTIGNNLPIAAYEAVLVPKGGAAPSSSGCTNYAFEQKPTLKLRAHVQNVGWQGWKGEGSIVGTTGRALRVEALQANLKSSLSGEVQINAHVQNIGWQGWKSMGKTAGTEGKSLRVEAFQMRLTGDLANKYDVYYRVHAEKFGWMGWAKNGESAGSQGFSFRLEAIEVRLVKKGAATPGSTSGAFYDAAKGTKYGWQNPSGYYQVSARNVTITSAARAPWNYVTPSRIGLWASRQDCVNAFLSRAREYVGSPYIWNYSCAPGVGVDCIGLVYQCAYACGMDLGGGTGNYDFNPWAHYSTGYSGWHSHDANNFWNYGKTMHVSVGSRRPGDVLYWPGHVAIYMGDDTLIEAYTPSTGVIYSSLSSRDYPSGCMRLFI